MGKFLDFSAVAKTNWAKPEIRKSPLWIVTALGVVLTLVMIFTAWFGFKISAGEVTIEGVSRGISSGYGIIALICTIVAVYGLLYRQYGMITLGMLITFVMVILFFVTGSFLDMTITSNVDGMSFSIDSIEDLDKLNEDLGRTSMMGISNGRIDTSFSVSLFNGIFAGLISLVTCILSFVLYRKDK